MFKILLQVIDNVKPTEKVLRTLNKKMTLKEMLQLEKRNTQTKRRTTHYESNIQTACVNWFRYAFPSKASLLFAIPNGGYRHAVTAKIMKAEGVVSGVADLILFVQRGGHGALCIEMKTAKGKQSDKQKAWQKAVEAQGYKYIICRSVVEFQQQVISYLRLKSASNLQETCK